jgi:hypothetical protein
MNSIKIPPLIMHKFPKNYSECGPDPFFFCRAIKSSLFYILHSSNNTFHFNNDTTIIIPKNTCKTIGFPCVIVTSLPAMCILTCAPRLHKLKLSYNINIMRANDNYLHLTLFNFSSETIEILPNQLQVICQVVIPGNLYNPFCSKKMIY